MTLFAAPYTLPLVDRLFMGGVRHTNRSGWLLHDTATDRIADAAPLPGFSPDSTDDVERALFNDAPVTASLSFALGCLRADSAPRSEVASASLVTQLSSHGRELDDLERVVKVKVNPARRDGVSAVVMRLTERGHRVRLDGNRGFELDEAIELAEQCASGLEFFEEPVAFADLERAVERMPVALDESLADAGPWRVEAAAYVLKPTILGHEATARFLEEARAHSIPVVISSAFESSVGRAHLIRLAHRVAPDAHHGLGTGRYFARDFEGWVERIDGWYASDRRGGPRPRLEWRECRLAL